MTIFYLSVIFILAWVVIVLTMCLKETNESHEDEIKKYQGFMDLAGEQYSALDKGYDEMEEGYKQMILDHQEQITAGTHAYLELMGEKDALVAGLKEEITRQAMNYISLEVGMDEMETGYQQMILDHQEQLQIQLHNVAILKDEIAEIELKKNTR